MLRSIEASYKIKLEDIGNECFNLDISCDISINQQWFVKLSFGMFALLQRRTKEIMCSTKPESRKKNISQKVKPKISQVRESTVSSKKDRNRNKNPRKNFQERLTKPNKKEEKNRKQHPELVSAMLMNQNLN
ncbi:hypothetical protein ACTXT7_015802 [Hymenolepis weldensis]